MDYWVFDLLVLALPVALLLRGSRPPRSLVVATGVLAAVAVLWTAPWDEHLVRSGVWTYGPDRVLATAGSVPVEEYAFVVLLAALVSAWGLRTGRLLVPTRPARGDRLAGAASWLAVGLAGTAALAVGGHLRYLGLLLVWVAPPLALQRAVAGDLLRPRLADRMWLVLPVAAWLCVADRLALADGIWTVSTASSTGVLLLGLPLEEALFFVLTSLLVADGLVLACDQRALARALALVRAAVHAVRPRPAPVSSLSARRS